MGTPSPIYAPSPLVLLAESDLAAWQDTTVATNVARFLVGEAANDGPALPPEARIHLPNLVRALGRHAALAETHQDGCVRIVTLVEACHPAEGTARIGEVVRIAHAWRDGTLWEASIMARVGPVSWGRRHRAHHAVEHLGPDRRCLIASPKEAARLAHRLGGEMVKFGRGYLVRVEVDHGDGDGVVLWYGRNGTRAGQMPASWIR